MRSWASREWDTERRLNSLAVLLLAVFVAYMMPNAFVLYSALGALILLLFGERVAWALAVLAAPLVTGGFFAWDIAREKANYDINLFLFDQLLPAPIGFLTESAVKASPVLLALSQIAYQSITLLLALVILDGPRSRPLLWKLVIPNFLAGFYFSILPACGPKYFLLAQTANAPHNAIPSLHFTWSLLIWWNRKNWSKPVRVLSGLLLFFTGLATLGFGEHYLVDLVVAVPFALATDSLWPWNWRQVLGGLAASFLWVAALRFVLPELLALGLASWALCLMTAVACAIPKTAIWPVGALCHPAALPSSTRSMTERVGN